MVVRIHQEKPSFATRPIEKLLDDEPVLSKEMLNLTRWIHRFYYCGWGEVIQTALPVGLNFYAEKYLKTVGSDIPRHLNETEREILLEINNQEPYLQKEAEKRWPDGGQARALKKLLRLNLVEVWEQPQTRMDPRTEKVWRWHPNISMREVNRLLEEYQREGKQYKWIKALELLTELDLPETQPKLTRHELLDSYTLNRIADEGLIESEEVESFDTTQKFNHDPSLLKTLNKEQQQAFEEILIPLRENRYQSFLLYGITGSGKTEVYIHALKKALESGKGGLILVPEISLTPQTVKRFYQIFGDDIAVLHSRLSNRERYDAWRALQKGEKRIAIGARSAVFAPVQNLGLIVVDEEHDGSYKQDDPAPRYHGRDVAIMRGYLSGATVVLGSATPSMLALYGAQRGKSTLLTLKKRHEGATLPEVHVLDLKQYRGAMRGPLTVPLYNAIEQALQQKEQVILLHNRRGFSSYLQCETCGHIAECPHCSVSLTFHKISRQLRCHYCGYTRRAPGRCPECSGEDLNNGGSGTQQVEEQIRELFPGANIMRMDRDTTSAKNSHETMLAKFDRGEIDILLGTQLVAKGLDFPNVTVVGVINADTELAFPSFRSGERMYQLLSQVAGRSGRADKKGRVYLQSWKTDHYAIRCARQHDHRTFAKFEMAHRKELEYPPYSRLISFQFKSKDAQVLLKVAHSFTESLRRAADKRPVLGPSPAAIMKMQGWVRWESLLKIHPDATASAIERVLDRAFEEYEQQKPKGASKVRINVNVDVVE